MASFHIFSRQETWQKATGTKLLALTCTPQCHRPRVLGVFFCLMPMQSFFHSNFVSPFDGLQVGGLIN